MAVLESLSLCLLDFEELVTDKFVAGSLVHQEEVDYMEKWALRWLVVGSMVMVVTVA